MLWSDGLYVLVALWKPIAQVDALERWLVRFGGSEKGGDLIEVRKKGTGYGRLPCRSGGLTDEIGSLSGGITAGACYNQIGD